MGSGEMRPMTSVRAAGYSSRGRTPAASGQGNFDPFVSPSNSSLQLRIDKPSEQIVISPEDEIKVPLHLTVRHWKNVSTL